MFSAFFFVDWWKLIEDLYNCVQCVWCFAKHEVHLWPYSQYGPLSCIIAGFPKLLGVPWQPFLRFHWWLWSPWDWWRWADHCGTGKYLECLDKEVLNYYKTPHLNLRIVFTFPKWVQGFEESRGDHYSIIPSYIRPRWDLWCSQHFWVSAEGILHLNAVEGFRWGTSTKLGKSCQNDLDDSTFRVDEVPTISNQLEMLVCWLQDILVKTGNADDLM